MKNLKLKLFGPVLLISLFIGLVACEAETIAEMEPPKDAPSKAMNDGPPPKKGPPPEKGPPPKKGDVPAPGRSPALNQALGNLTSEGELTVCTDAPYEPFEYEDDMGNWTGFDMDIMRDISGRMGA